MPKTLDDWEKTFANKSAQYWASMRTNLQLMGRSDNIDNLLIDIVEKELSDILDSGILTYPHTLSQLGISSSDSLIERKQQFGLRSLPLNHTENEQKFLDNMSNKADAVRKSNWSWRIAQEAEEKQKLGWHPFFVTLTVDPQKEDPKTLWQKGREFRKYIRRLANVVCKELGDPPSHKPPYRSESTYVTYAGVIEHGKSREHHHAHYIIWLRAIPKSWRKDPNTGINNPANRTKNECLPMRTLWPHSLPGLSPALYFRTIGDVWERAYNFTLPIKDGQPMKVSNPAIAGYYITKYLSKEHKEWHHRMRATRNLGMKTLNQFLKQQNHETIKALTWRAENSNINHSLMMTHTVPLGLLRSQARQRDYLLKFRHKQLDLTQLLTSNSQIFTRMLSSVRSGIRPDRMDSCQFYDWVGTLLPVQREYSREKLVEAHKTLSGIYPVDKTKIHHTKLGGNEIGHP